MAESALHTELVRKMFYWVRDNVFFGDAGSIFVSLPESNAFNKPPALLWGYEPDLYAINYKSDLLVLGEAKTIRDIDTRHSIEQYKSCFETCIHHNGPSFLVLAVPFYWKARMSAIIHNHIRLSKSVNMFKFEILEF